MGLLGSIRTSGVEPVGHSWMVRGYLHLDSGGATPIGNSATSFGGRIRPSKRVPAPLHQSARCSPHHPGDPVAPTALSRFSQVGKHARSTLDRSARGRALPVAAPCAARRPQASCRNVGRRLTNKPAYPRPRHPRGNSLILTGSSPAPTRVSIYPPSTRCLRSRRPSPQGGRRGG